MSRPIWLVELIKRTFPQRFLAARTTRMPLLGSLLDHWLFEGDDLFYLPKEDVARTVAVSRVVARPLETVLPSQVVEHFITSASVHWIMDSCICRDASECRDYPADLGCLFLGEAALGINSKLGRRVSESEALEHVRRCREAGLVHLVGRNRLDTVWLGVGPGERLLTVCNCCPCCCLWRILPDVAPHIADKVTRMPGVEVAVRSEECQGCGICASGVCFAAAIHMEEGRAVIGRECRGCGRCVEVCPNGAIELSLERDQYVERAIARISPLVDVS